MHHEFADAESSSAEPKSLSAKRKEISAKGKKGTGKRKKDCDNVAEEEESHSARVDDDDDDDDQVNIADRRIEGEPREIDVLCGRGGTSNHHPGNEWYRRLIRSNRALYRSCPKHTKLLVSKAIVQAVYPTSGPWIKRRKACAKRHEQRRRDFTAASRDNPSRPPLLWMPVRRRRPFLYRSSVNPCHDRGMQLLKPVDPRDRTSMIWPR
jgi:hypothetical protein